MSRTVRPAGLRTGLAAAALAALGAALIAGCSLARSGGQGGEGPSSAGARSDSAPTAVRADSPAARPARRDTAPDARTSPADSVLRALRDSARAMQTRRGHGGDSARGDTTGPRPGTDRAEGEDVYPHGPVRTADVDSLAAIGPVYTPYDRGPVMRTGEYLDGLLKATLVPVIHERDLSPETWARFWVLVDADGRVRATELHLGSGHAAFDAAAKAVAERLRYLPAERDGSPVPVWVLARISLLMG